MPVGVGGGDGVEGGEEGAAAADLVGLRAAHGDEGEERGPVIEAEVFEVGDDVASGRRIRRRSFPEDRTHRVVVGRQWVAHAAEEEIVDGGQQQVGSPLGHRCLVDQRQHVGIVGDAPADGVVRRRAVAGRASREEAEPAGQ